MRNKQFLLAVAIIAVGLILTGVGVYIGENKEIMRKGVTVCLECIGIG